MDDRVRKLVTGKRGGVRDTAWGRVPWRELLGPELTEALIADAQQLLKTGEWKQRAKWKGLAE
jgi:hypothetical protein